MPKWPSGTFLAELGDNYDLVLIDCPPNLHLCSWAALVASDYVLVPLQPEDYGAQGIADVQASISRVQSGPNPGLKLLGFLITMRSTRANRAPALRGKPAVAVWRGSVHCHGAGSPRVSGKSET